MRIAGALVALLLAAPVVRADELAALDKLVSAHCIRCHDADSILDLRELPSRTDVKTWSRMLTLLEESKMPPPARTGTIAERFPLDPAVREEMIDLIGQLLGSNVTMRIRPLHLGTRVWTQILKDLAKGIVSPARMDVVLEAGGRSGAGPQNLIQAPYQLYLDRLSLALCTEIDQVEAKAPAISRKLVPALSKTSRAAVTAWSGEAVRLLQTALLREPPEAKTLDEERERLNSLYKLVKNADGAWMAYCTETLSGPQLQYSMEN